MKPFKLILVAMLSAIAIMAGAVEPSGTLPVLHISTEGNAPITSKETYLNATFYLDALGLEGYESFGSAESPLTMQIKGRGNYTWTGFDKKPYRVKLTSKAALLGMKASKHFALLAHADDELAFLRNTMGLELSRRLGLAYTPEQRPVEVVLNGDYIGLYFLTETIRVDANRVNITEQPDQATDPEAITGGWLVEIDNYDDPAQITINENKGSGETMRFTYKSPEVLSQQQTDYLLTLVTNADAAIYADDKSDCSWMELIDADALARFYLVQELTDNGESFHGSCYFHKDIGNDSKIVFGPVWDFGNSFRRGTDRTIASGTDFHQHWIGEIVKYEAFNDIVKQIWQNYIDNLSSGIESFIASFSAQIREAANCDHRRWPQYGCDDVTSASNTYLSKFRAKTEWLKSHFGYSGAEPTSYFYMVGASSVLGSWQPSQAPAFTATDSEGTYTIYFDNLDQLQSGFKIIDFRDWNHGIYGSNGNPLVPNIDYTLKYMATGTDENITLDTNELSNVTAILRGSGTDWILRLATSAGTSSPDCAADIASISASRGSISITPSAGKTLLAKVVSVEGRCIFTGAISQCSSIATLPGIYLVSLNNSAATKVIVR